MGKVKFRKALRKKLSEDVRKSDDVRKKTLNGIVSYPEQPDKNEQLRIEAHDLFSLFTASIIKKKTTFTR